MIISLHYPLLIILCVICLLNSLDLFQKYVIAAKEMADEKFFVVLVIKDIATLVL